jgi:hypothetical protein
MIALQPQQIDKQMYWGGAIILVLVFGRYGLQTLDFFLMKMYEFFIQNVSIKI